MTIGAFLEERTVAKARAGIESLVHMTPTAARVIKEGKESIIPASENCSACGAYGAIDPYEMYQPYIDGIKEIAEITKEFQASYLR